MIRDVGVGELVEELEQRGDRLPFEIGAFVALEACEGLLQESVKLEPDDVRVTLEGSVVVAESAPPAAPEEAADSLVSVLARLLVAAGPGVPPYLLQLVKDSKTGHTTRGLRDLHDAIEASLIPINRGASRRVLARLVRESDRPPAPEVAQVDPHALDAELDELLRDPVLRTQGPEPAPLPIEEPITERIRIPRRVWADTDTDTGADAGTGTAAGADAGAGTGTGTDAGAGDAAAAPKTFPPPVADDVPETLPVPASEPALQGASVPIPDLRAPAAAAAAPKRREMPEPITATIRKWQPQDEPAPVSASAPAPASATEPAPVSAPAPASAAAPEPLPARPSRPSAAPEQPYDRPSLPQQPPKRRGGWGIWLLAAGLGVGAYALMATGTLDSLLQQATPAPAPAVGGTIDVSVTPADAQIFVFVGRGPAVAEGLAVDSAHEFIVFDQGLRPSRAIVPKGATWATAESGPIYELAVQAESVGPSDASSDLRAPQTEPSASAAGGTGVVRVITNPPRAKVYRFVGVGPSAEISVSSIHEGQEVLVYHPGYETRRAVIGPSDWQKAAGADSHGASLSVQLPALPDSAPAEALED